MTPKLRRVLSFVVLAGGGLLILVLLSDDTTRPAGPILGKSQPDDQGSLSMVDAKTGAVDQITLRDVSFERTRPFEVAPGRFEERADLSVSLKNGRGTPEGDLEMESPVIRFLDVEDGHERGWVTADTGRFFGIGTSVGSLRVDVDHDGPDAFALIGHVTGELPLGPGQSAGLQADSLRFEDETAEAPGVVVLRHGALTLTGTHMTWDGKSGRLVLASDVVVTLPVAEGTPEIVLESPGGLVWHVPVDGGGRGWGELLGPVSGRSDNGGRLSCAHMELLADASAVTLVGAAEVRLENEAGTRSLQAERITLSLGGNDGLSLSEAEGGVTLVLADADGGSTSVRTATLVTLGGELVAEGQLVFEQDGLTVSGRGWRWNERTRELSVASELVVAAADVPTSPFAGMRVRASSLSATLPADGGLEASRLRLDGPVAADLPDGSSLSCASIVHDGPSGSVTFAGRVVVDVPHAGAERHLEADTLLLGLDGGLPGSLSGRGRVRVVLRDAGGEPTWLSAERLDVIDGETRAPGPVRVERGGLVLSGDDLGWDEAERRLDLVRDAVVEVRDDAGRDDRLRSPGGLTWWFPAADATGATGHGELHGPVTGRSADGTTLAARRVSIDATHDVVTLFGDGRIDLASGGSLRTDELTARRVDGLLVLDAPGRMAWTDEGLLVEGVGFAWDEADGRLGLLHDVHLEQREPDGTLRLELHGAGPLEWFVPRSDDEGARGSLAGGFTGRNAAGDELSGTRLELDEDQGRLVLQGDARAALATGGELRAATSIVLLRDGAGDLLRLEARDDVQVTHASEGELWTARADSLAVDVPAHTTVFAGAVRLEHRVGADLTTLATGPTGRLQAVTDARDALIFVDAVGRIQVTTGDLLAEADEASFDVRDDHVILEGACRFSGIAGAMSAPRVEIWPRQMRWHVPHSVIEPPGKPSDG